VNSPLSDAASVVFVCAAAAVLTISPNAEAVAAAAILFRIPFFITVLPVIVRTLGAASGPLAPPFHA
jgi:uncharacterized membrane protein